MRIRRVKIRRLKIVEQIGIVMFFAILIPMVTSGIIISNVNQHSVRKELVYSTSMISEVIAKNINTFFDAERSELASVALALKNLPNRSFAWLTRRSHQAVRLLEAHSSNIPHRLHC